MRLPSWLRPFATHLNPGHKRRIQPRPTFRPRIEELVDRITPSAVQLTNSSINFVSDPTNLTTVNSTLYFVANDGSHGTELWRTDGKPGDAVRVQGGHPYFDPATGGVVPEQAQVGRWLYFFTDNGNSNGEESYTLWRNDSTASPTGGISSSEQVLTIPGPTNDWGPYQLKAVGNDLYFGTSSAPSTDTAWELCQITGADAPSGANLTATQLQSSVNKPQIDSNGPTNIWAAGSEVYFTADAPDGSGLVLWGSDGTPDETAPVQDTSGYYVSPYNFSAAAVRTDVGTDLYTIDTHGNLYQVSGLGATPVTLVGLGGTQITSLGGAVTSLISFDGFISSYHMTVAGDSVYFLASDPNSRSGSDFELWKCEGSIASEVWQSQTGSSSFNLLQIAAVGSDVYFTDSWSPQSVTEDLWKSNGTPEGTELMKSFEEGSDIRFGGVAGNYTSTTYIPFGLTPVGSTLYFEGPDGRLWQSGGTPETTYSIGGYVYGGGNGYQATSSVAEWEGLYRNPDDFPGAYSPFAAIGSTLYISPFAFFGGVGQLWRLNNPPGLNSAVSSATDTSISGTFGESADPNTTITLNFYANTVADPSGAGPGQTALGSTTVTTDANGNTTFSADLAVGNLAGQWITATATDPSGNTSDFAHDVQATTASSQTYDLQAALPQSSSTANSITLQASASDTPATVIGAVNGLTNVTQPVTIVLDLGGGTYDVTNVNVDPPTNVTLDIQNGILTGNKSLSSAITISGGTVNLFNVTVDPDYPALTVTGGQVSVLNSTLTTTGNAPTLLVASGNVTLSDDEISQTSTTSTQPAIAVMGGTLNLGSATSPGNNTLSVNGSSNVVSNNGGSVVSDGGNTFVIGGTSQSALSLSFTSLTSSSASSALGDPVTFTATVAPDMPGSATPTGAVQFQIDGVNAGAPVALGGGTASFSTSTLEVGTHTITATYSGDGTFLGSNSTLTQVVNKATPYFSLGAPPTSIDGTSDTLISGIIAAGSLIPSGCVTVTVNNISRSATINPDGTFAVMFPTASLGTGTYSIVYSYAGDGNFMSASATANMDVTDNVLALFNQSQSKHAGSTIPIQIELVSASGQDLSSAGTTVTALGIAATTDTTDTTGSIDPSLVGSLQPVQAAGNSNPDNVFREQGGSQPFYMYNLQTPTGLTAGTYRLYFQVQGDPLMHWVTFSVS